MIGWPGTAGAFRKRPTRTKAAEASAAQHTLLEYCWNHTTLHALRDDKTITYLQTAYEYGREHEQLEAIRRETAASL